MTSPTSPPPPEGGDASARPDLSPERAANLAENPHAGQGSVLLDVGGDIGAIVLYLSADLEGAEIEFSRVDPTAAAGNDADHEADHQREHGHGHGHGHGHQHRPHVAVVGRPAGGRLLYSAVFPDLEAGTYRLNQAGETLSVDVVVKGGVVAEVTWPH